MELGEKTLSLAQIQLIKEGIEPLGFELIGDRKSRIIESIKNLIIELVHQTDEFKDQDFGLFEGQFALRL